MKKGRELNLDDPSDARFFMRGVRIDGKHIEFVELEDGRTLKVEEMTDFQVVYYAKDIYFDYCGGVEGEGGVIELNTMGMDQ